MKAARADSEDSFDRGDDDSKRDLMTSTYVKSEQTGSFYMVTLYYVVVGDKYHLSVKDITKRI